MGNLNGKNVFRILHACRLYHYNFHLPGVSCPALVAPANGNLNPSSCTTSGNVFEGKCHYSCQSGYQISGVQVKNCLNTGQWDSQEEPTCQIRKPVITKWEMELGKMRAKMWFRIICLSKFRNGGPGNSVLVAENIKFALTNLNK